MPSHLAERTELTEVSRLGDSPDGIETPDAIDIIDTTGTPSQVRYEDRLITRQELSRWLGISVDRLSVWAQERQGPRALRIGRYKARYRIGDVIEWLAGQDACNLPTMRRGGRRRAATGQFTSQAIQDQAVRGQTGQTNQPGAG